MPFEGTDFVDTDYQPAGGNPPRQPAPTPAGRAPTREELDGQLTATQQQLAKLREAQEQLERAKAAIEEMRRRRAEFQTGREEMLQHLIRGVGTLEQAELKLRRDAQQMARSLEGLRGALGNVQQTNEQAWTEETWETELSRALTVIDNARMEWNQARLAWPILDGQMPSEPGKPQASVSPTVPQLGFGQLVKIGLAINWPVVVLALVVLVLALKR
jgi:hypothetical protein